MIIKILSKEIRINDELVNEYEKIVRPLNQNGIDYIISAFDIDVSSDHIEQIFSNALKEELEVAHELPEALEEALENGIFE